MEKIIFLILSLYSINCLCLDEVYLSKNFKEINPKTISLLDKTLNDFQFRRLTIQKITALSTYSDLIYINLNKKSGIQFLYNINGNNLNYTGEYIAQNNNKGVYYFHVIDSNSVTWAIIINNINKNEAKFYEQKIVKSLKINNSTFLTHIFMPFLNLYAVENCTNNSSQLENIRSISSNMSNTYLLEQFTGCLKNIMNGASNYVIDACDSMKEYYNEGVVKGGMHAFCDYTKINQLINTIKNTKNIILNIAEVPNTIFELYNSMKEYLEGNGFKGLHLGLISEIICEALGKMSIPTLMSIFLGYISESSYMSIISESLNSYKLISQSINSINILIDFLQKININLNSIGYKIVLNIISDKAVFDIFLKCLSIDTKSENVKARDIFISFATESSFTSHLSRELDDTVQNICKKAADLVILQTKSQKNNSINHLPYPMQMKIDFVDKYKINNNSNRILKKRKADEIYPFSSPPAKKQYIPQPPSNWP